MIIKEARIESFAGLENKIIKFHDGMNVIYGENERGKSRIESFLKCMLYGMSSKRVKGESERIRFASFNGSVSKGELLVEHEDKTYIIKRSFGKTKKDDSSVILDYLTGEEQKEINKEEPGKYFLGVNKSTFEKTLFIGQLGVQVKKDKEEEIMEKITGLFGCAENELPAAKAIEKLEVLKKSVTTTRGTGSLDKLKKYKSLLTEERYEAYNLAEKNLSWEQELLSEKERRKNLIIEIDKLEVYKKYLKKIKLQKEYKEITEYLKKSEELRNEEKKLTSGLSNGKDIIDETFIDNLKEENIAYLALLDKLNECKEEADKLNADLKTINIEYEKYKYLELFGEGIKDNVTKLKYEQKSLSEKIQYINSIKESINNDESDLRNKKEIFKDLLVLEDIGDDIESTLKNYEEKLINLKSMAENNDTEINLDDRVLKNKISLSIGVVAGIVGFSLIFMGIPLSIIGTLILIAGIFTLGSSYLNLTKLNENIKIKKEIQYASKDIENIEDTLNQYMKMVKVNDYKALMKALRQYESFKDYENRALVRIQEKNKLLQDKEYEDIAQEYSMNNEVIKSLFNVSNSKDIDEVLDKINLYEKLKVRIDALDEKRIEKNKVIQELSKDIKYKEKILKDKLDIMDLDLGNLLDIEVYIKEYKDKLKKYREVHNNLNSMEETYKVLLKDRDIDSIREELKDIINDNNEFSYESEEEIELEEKNKSKNLIECEKNIKDIENKINTRLIGKRNIIEIEEEMNLVEEKVKKEENYLKALDIAIETMKESFNELRREIGPKLNSSILENFKFLTDNKYGEVLIDENYDMTVRDGNSLFKGNYLSNGALDQLYLSLRLAFIQLLFNNEKCPIILDDAFVQYDNKRREKGLLLINNKIKGQVILFTCHDLEEKILRHNNIDFNFITLVDNNISML